MNETNDEKIERLLKGALSGLPLRCAPDALQRRVLVELAHRAAMPWWRRNFAQWPMAARTAFVVVCLLLAGLSLSSLSPSSVWTQQLGAQTLSWAQPLIGAMASIGGVLTLAASLLPPLFVYVALGVGALLYTALFGLGAFAYRALYLQHSNTATLRS